MHSGLRPPAWAVQTRRCSLNGAISVANAAPRRSPEAGFRKQRRRPFTPRGFFRIRCGVGLRAAVTCETPDSGAVALAEGLPWAGLGIGPREGGGPGPRRRVSQQVLCAPAVSTHDGGDPRGPLQALESSLWAAQV